MVRDAMTDFRADTTRSRTVSADLEALGRRR